MLINLEHPDGEITVEELASGKRRILVQLLKRELYMPISTWDTTYPLTLIKQILSVKGPAYLCDEIMRDEAPRYIQRCLKFEILSYLDESDFTNKRILDFGCGCGASTMVLARMFPTAEIIGIELVEEFLSVARLRAKHYGFDRVSFLTSPDGKNLPESIGEFDFVIFSAVYEHLLPEERKVLLPKVWLHLRPLGVLFLGQTPNRHSPLESHTTGLPLLNYLPDRLALHFARRYSKRVQSDESWEDLLRKGIRGGTEIEIMGMLSDALHEPILLEPQRFGMNDRIDLWYNLSSSLRLHAIKRLMMFSIKAFRSVTGVMLIPSLSLAIKKGPSRGYVHMAALGTF